MEKPTWRSGFKALGTDIEIQMVLDEGKDKESAEKDIANVKEIYLAKQKIFSRFDPESELTRLNKKLGVFQKASLDIMYLAKRALIYHKLSDGLYDPRIIEVLERIGYDKDFRLKDFSKAKFPESFSVAKTGLGEDLKIRGGDIYFRRRMDFSGIAKGYITDYVAGYLKKQGWKNFLVDAGGDMMISGANSEGKKWRIAVEGIPEDKLMLEISNAGIATSGISRKKWQIKGKKFHHLVNPKNPNEFLYELRTVSVIEENTENADGRAKTLVLMGKDQGFQFAKENKIAAIFLDYKVNVFTSNEAKRFIAI